MKQISLKHLILAIAISSFAGAAFAQYVWIDERGVKQYSDIPPPSSVPKSRILKERGRPVAPAANDQAANESATTASLDKKAPMTTAEKNAEFQKRRTEQAEKEKKANEEAKIAAENSKNCERARNYKRTLESGERIAQNDQNGERSFMTDEQRAHELREVGQLLQKCK
ncbi:DUF4124 domain-containing protein [Noviherbaspirillum massiliense]|uniref:DUF4124 domain-containing protein n=1 Tax=Noviherbaspirillum massiliense TaxID=1465823 RepID=UPI0003171AA0|nr:DUF4124 domain-containing protein [Noviherbaspirillum massiliense]